MTPLERSFSGIERIVFVVDARSRGSRSRAPVIQDLGDMYDALGLLSSAQNQVVVLAAIESRVEEAGFSRQLLANHQQMANVVFRKQQIGRPIGFEKWIGALALRPDLVFIAIKQVGAGILTQRIAYIRKRVRSQRVVVIEETYVGSGHRLPCTIRRPRDSTALLPIGHFNAAILRGVSRKNFADLCAIGAIVRDAQFPALIRLA